MRKRSKAEWQEVIAEYKRSGERQEDWCKSKSINVYTFRNKIMQLSKANTTANKKTNREIKWLTIPNEEKVSTVGRNESLEIEINGFTIQAHKGFNEDLLLRVCKVLKQLC